MKGIIVVGFALHNDKLITFCFSCIDNYDYVDTYTMTRLVVTVFKITLVFKWVGVSKNLDANICLKT